MAKKLKKQPKESESSGSSFKTNSYFGNSNNFMAKKFKKQPKESESSGNS